MTRRIMLIPIMIIMAIIVFILGIYLSWNPYAEGMITGIVGMFLGAIYAEPESEKA